MSGETGDSSWPPAVEYSYLLLFPLFSYFALNYAPINQVNFLDSWYYTGYTNNWSDMVGRFVYPYFAVRFGHILPARFFVWIFGPIGGYLVFRYVLILTAGIPLYLVTKKYVGGFAAVLTYAAFMGSPLIARNLLWDYVSSSSMTYLIAGICLFLLGGKQRLPLSFLAGCFIGLALNSQIFTVSVAGLFALAFLISAAIGHAAFRVDLVRRYVVVGGRERQWDAELVRRSAWAVAGVVSVFVAAGIYYHLASGHWNFLFPTIHMASWMNSGGAKTWRTPGIAWMASAFEVLLPILLILYCWFAGQRRKWAFFERTVFLFSLLLTGFYYVYHFAFSSQVLQFTWYVCYLAPALFLMLGLLYGVLWNQPEGRAARFVGLPLLGASFFLPWVLQASGTPMFAWLRLWHYLVLAGATGTMVVVCAKTQVVGRKKLTMEVLATLLLGLTFNASFAAPIYSSMVKPYGTHDSTEMDVYRVALQLMKAIPPVSERPGKLQFWYGDRADTDTIDSVQSVYLWGGFSRCIPVPRQPDDNGMPHIGPFERKVFKDTKYLALLGEREGDIRAGVAALSAERIPFRFLEARELSSGSYRLYLQIVELMHDDSR